jgi:ribonuclease VapC
VPIYDAPAVVLDASALIAMLYEEKGADRVEMALRRGGVISAVNWAEALSDMAERGEAPELSAPRATKRIEEFGALTIVPLDERQAVEVARLRLKTRSLRLSLADRCCLTLARLRRLPVLTTDRAWRSLYISVRIEVIR